METEQGTLTKRPKGRTQSSLPLWLREQLAGQEREPGIVPLESNALGLRYLRLRPGPELALTRPELEQPQTELLEVPSVAERRLRIQVGELVATQAVEDEGALRGPRGQGLYHRYNAVLKRALGGKGRGAMALAELEAAVGWLERNRLGEHLHLLDGDARYSWTVRQRRDWTPPVGRSDGKPRGATRLSTLSAHPTKTTLQSETSLRVPVREP